MQARTNGARPPRGHTSADARRLEGLADLASNRDPDPVERTMALAREALGMDVAFVSEFAEDRMEFRALEGDAESFGWREGGGVPLEGTFCKRVVDGTLPNVVPDAKSDGRVSGLEVTHEAGICSYVGVPLRFSDGRVYGTLCCLSHSPKPRLRERDARFVGVLARLVADQIEREELEAERRRLKVRATGVGALLAALVARDGYTGAHSEAVVGHSVAVARRMGLPEEGVAEVEQAALLHDIGKIGIGEAILNKPGPLNEAEREVMRMHPAIGGGGDRRLDGGPLAPGAGDQGRAREVGRQGLPRRPLGGGDPDREQDRPRLRRLSRDDERPPLPRGDRGRGGAGGTPEERRGAVLPAHRGSVRGVVGQGRE